MPKQAPSPRTKSPDWSKLAVKAAERAGFGPEHVKLTFDGSFPTFEPVLKTFATMEYQLDPDKNRSIIIAGNVGVGKTALLSAMYKELFMGWAKKYTSRTSLLPAVFSANAIVVTHAELVAIFHDQFKQPMDRTENVTMQDLREVGLLMFDDLGSGHDSAANISGLEELIEYRWRNERPIWATTNFKLSKLRKMDGYERLVSRLAHRAVQIELTGKDRRIT